MGVDARWVEAVCENGGGVKSERIEYRGGW